MKSIDYALLGHGNMARHIHTYFSLLNIPHKRWSRKNNQTWNSSQSENPEQRLQEVVRLSSHILLALSDDSLVPFLDKNQNLFKGKKVIHFSGAISTPLGAGAHPLMTFGSQLYDLKTYQSIPFIMEKGVDSFKKIFPQFKNPYYEISKEQKPFYHSLCVMGGNFTTYIWKIIFHEMKKTMDLPEEILKPFLKQNALNLINNPNAPFSGPLARNDKAVIESHLKTLEKSPLFDFYQNFLNFYEKTHECI